MDKENKIIPIKYNLTDSDNDCDCGDCCWGTELYFEEKGKSKLLNDDSK